MSSAVYFIKCSVYWWLVSYEFCLELVKMFTCRISSLSTKLSSHFLPGNAEDACSEKYVDGLLHKTGENYEWPIDAQGNTSRGSLGHPEVSCKPECFFPVQCPSLVMDCLESRPLRALQQPWWQNRSFNLGSWSLKLPHFEIHPWHFGPTTTPLSDALLGLTWGLWPFLHPLLLPQLSTRGKLRVLPPGTPRAESEDGQGASTGSDFLSNFPSVLLWSVLLHRWNRVFKCLQ